ncbi:unnamed protein product [Ranitomeya imitator]|uniref:Protein-tyrosine-phosphatase n=1 Tax=Ranitomeya imitator TaxID=111125 RepID=A0ABN9MGX4_9NEOB|nr:unnamed protein product [Ranitomeya imitator]
MDIQALCSSMDNLVVNVQKIQDTIDQKSMLEPRIPIPDLFFGDRTKFLSFRNNCKLFLALKPHSSGNPIQQVLIIISFLRGDPQDWAFSLAPGDSALSNVDAFFQALGLLYDEPNSVDQAEKNLLALCQGQDDVEVYCQKFRKWSVLTLWNESALAALFRKGLSEALKDVMVGFPMPAGLNESMSLAIQIGRRLRERKSVHHLAVLSESKPEPTQCDRTMTKVERQEHRRLNRLCFYCGDSTHAISNCPKCTRRFDSSAVIGTVQSKFLLSITLMCSLSSYSVMAFVDSGAALNLMDLDYAKRCGFFLEPLRCPIPLRGIDATPLAKNKPQYWAQLTMCMAPAHQEVIRFLKAFTDAPRTLRSQECIAVSRDDDVAVLRDRYVIISRDRNAWTGHRSVSRSRKALTAAFTGASGHRAGNECIADPRHMIGEDQIPRGFPTIDMGPQLKVVERTRTATMLCAASGNPDPEISWFKDYLPVDTSNSNGRIKQLRSGALQIEQSEEADQGKYECVATNSAGTRYSAPANLYVRVRRIAPRFSIPPTNHEIMPGGSVNITCVAVGSPMPYVKWMLGAEDLTPEDDMPIGRNVLELTDVRQSANYTCVAMSTLGVIEAIAQITVKALPRPPGTPVVTESTATSITLTWDSGNPEPVTYYIIQHKPKSSEEQYKEIDGVATTRYSVAGLSPYSEYEFRVVAVNNIGRGPPSEPVTTRTSEQAPSSAPRNVQARMLSSTTILVQWEEPEEPNGQIQGYRVYYTMDPTQHINSWTKYNVADSQITTIGNLVPQKTYSVKVLAFTSVGDGPLSNEIQVITQTGVPSQPLNFKAEAESETSILLSWTPPRSDTISSYKLYYKEGDHAEEDGNQGKHRVTKCGPALSNPMFTLVTGIVGRWRAVCVTALQRPNSDAAAIRIVQSVTTEPTTSYRLQGLKPNTLYYFRLAAEAPLGLGASTTEISAKTLQSKPSAPPQDIRCNSQSSTSILVSWLPPPEDKQNGAITAYSINYSAVDGEDNKPHEITVISSDTRQYLLDQLEKWTQYQISMIAYTDVGPGPESPSILVRTDEDVPSGPPRKVEVEAVNSTAVKVFWRSPVSNKQHGQIRGYQVHYVRMENGEPKGPPMLKDVMLADAQEMIISGLQPETAYAITVTAYTTKGDGARSKPKVVTTSGAVPGRPRLVINHTQMNTALVQWYPPVETFGPVMGYRLKYGRKDIDILTTLEFSEKEDHFTAKEIHKGASYVFKLSARNKVGFGEENIQEITIPEETPTGFPQNLHCDSMSSTSVQITWQPPILAERNGVMIKYTLLYRDINNPYNPFEVPIVPAGTTVTITALKPDTFYDVKIRAHTSKGPGPFSPSVQFRTLPVDQAVFAKNFHVKAVMKTSVLLSWEIPENYNSALPFKILYDDGKKAAEVDGRATQKLITNLKPETLYSFVLTNRGNSAGGLQHRVAAKTAPDVLRTKPVFIGKTNTDGMITVELPEVPANEKIKYLLKDISRKRRSIRFRREVESKPYIAAHFDVLPTEFTLGDQKNYGGFENKQLQNGQEYVFFVLAIIEHTELPARPISDRYVIILRDRNALLGLEHREKHRNNCKLFLSLKSRSSGDPAQQVKIVISFLRGDPQNWAFALAPGDPALLNVDAFFLALGLLYEEPNLEIQAEKALLALSQGQDEAELYCQKFRKWSVLTQWNECALAARFRDGLSEAIKDVMVGFPAPTGLNESMTMAIQIDRRLRERKPVHHLAVSSEQAPETMQCDRIQSRSERQNYRRKNGLCFYCAISVDAYVDSGAALSLMDWSFVNRCGFSLEPLEVPIPLKGIDSTPLAMNKPQYWTQVTMRMTPVHQEVIRFLSFMHDIFREYLDKFMIVYLDDVLVFSDDWESHVQQNVVRLHGIPENIVSDRGSQFVSRFWRTFCAKMGIDLSFSSAFHPQTNGQTEQTNQTLETYLRCFVSADQDDWVTFLPLAEFALNNRASSATLVSPFFCNSGFHPRFSSGQVEPSDCPGVDMVVDRLHQIWSHVVDNLKLSQERAQQFANRRRRVGPRLRVGDLVWLSSRFVPMKVSSPKFKPRFIGPYRILEILNPVSFRLDLPASFAIHNVFHRSLLRKYESQVSESSIRVKYQSQVSESSIRVRYQSQVSESSIRVKYQSKGRFRYGPIRWASRSGASHLHRMTSSSYVHTAAPAQAYFFCPVEGRAKYSSAQAPGKVREVRRLRTSVLCSALNLADKVHLHRSRSVKTRRGRHPMKIGGPRPRRPSDRTAAGPPIVEYNLTSFSHLSGVYYGGQRMNFNPIFRPACSKLAYFVCPVEGRAKYCNTQVSGLSDLSRGLRTAVLCSALNRADKVCLRRSRSVKTRKERHRKKMEGPGPDHDSYLTGP